MTAPPSPLPPYLQFWGKAQAEEGAAIQWHPAAYHCLDVAAVAEELQRKRLRQTERMADRVGLAVEDFIRLNTFLIALHDLGKFSRSFQALASDIQWPEALGACENRPAPPNSSHWELTGTILLDRFSTIKLFEKFERKASRRLKNLIPAIAGHHGKPPTSGQTIDTDFVCNNCIEAANQFIDDLFALLNPPTSFDLPVASTHLHSYWLAGLTVTADWLGSNTEFFKYKKPKKTLADYWQTTAQPQASKAVIASGLLPSPADRQASLASMFDILDARPMQEAMEEATLHEGPTLYIIEDATGSGKTEAATLLAQRLMQEGKAGGLFFALPTMATANGMFTRMKKDYKRLYEEGSRPSLALAHGRAKEHEGFREVALPPQYRQTIQTGDDRDTAAECAEWIADDRRKTFFAEIGVGTIDQALLSVLPSKFQALRLWGLSDRVIIVDEAHAYDAYMSTELETLLEFHAALGGSAIILSATLPAQKRSDLVAAFRKGAGATDAAHLPANKAYPLVTIAHRNGISETTNLDAAEHTRRTVTTTRLPDTETALQVIETAAHKGAAVAYICNAVDDAIAAWEALQARGLEPDLFHARLAMGDRQQIEQSSVDRFGKDGKPEQRKGRILVATQVIEQSLDLDFDLMVTDLAPIDLLIQRAGRLWRHMDIRPKESRPVKGPELCIVAPDPDPDRVKDDKWLDQLDQRGRFVYRNHALLWRTAKLLFDKGNFQAPEDLRDLIEGAYDPDNYEGEPDTPEALNNSEFDAIGKDIGDETSAVMNLLKLEKGYAKYDRWFNAEEGGEVFTRLGEKTRMVRLARIDGDRLAPWIEHKDSVRGWTLSEITIRQKWLDQADIADNWRNQIETIRKDWPRFQKDMLIAPVDGQGNLLLDNLPARLTYDETRGLEKTDREC